MNRHYVYDEETPMTTQRESNWLAAAGLLLLLVIGALAMLFVTYKAVAQSQPRTATITFQRPTKYTDGTDIPASVVISYEVWQGPRGACAFTDPIAGTGGYTGAVVNSGCTKTKVSTITGTSTTINTGLQPGETCWQLAAIAQGPKGQLSPESAPGAAVSSCKTFLFPAPDVVTITVI